MMVLCTYGTSIQVKIPHIAVLLSVPVSNEISFSNFILNFLLSSGKQIRSYEAVDGKNPITAVNTMPAPHCSVVFGSADSVLRFIDPRKPGLQVVISLSELSLSRTTPTSY